MLKKLKMLKLIFMYDFAMCASPLQNVKVLHFIHRCSREKPFIFKVMFVESEILTSLIPRDSSMFGQEDGKCHFAEPKRDLQCLSIALHSE